VNNWYNVYASAQPNFYDFWTALYERYIPSGAVFDITVTNPGTESVDIGLLALPDNTVVPTDLQRAREYPLSKFITVPTSSNLNVKKLSFSVPFDKIMCRKS
jgi:hypothetical protein